MRFTRVIVTVVALSLLASIPAITVRADDTATSKPAAAAGSVTVNVVDATGAPVEGCTVKVGAPKKKGEAAPEPLATGETDATGAVTSRCPTFPPESTSSPRPPRKRATERPN